ncbi:HAD-IB family hydrolase [Nocardioides sp. MAH-18]|uniref:HAD-IB family hydrolase n=1 Tax=Nocardioides agri TaxID=2682843 RepID=A0A6L6XVD0_9ACTN|nr:HAD-IB family hydrolase [Nocardioides sp. MAH-18]
MAERLDGQHVLLTGVTGFVGEALLLLLLSDVPGVRVTVLVRPKGSTSAAARTAALLRKPAFADVVEAAGGVDELMAARVDVLEGDLADAPVLPSGLHAVVHCAGDVSFDPPVDEGFRTNVQGTRELLARVREAGPDLHYVHISTAYVAGRRRGSIPEGPVDHDVDLEAELAWGLSQRRVVEHQSRSATVLERERRKAERTHSRAGLLTAAAATESARKEWVKRELVRIGSERARSLGWTDCYTFTKALGERVVEQHARDAAQPRRVSIVRPSIIESALERPYPGWIEGFKMAEPLILAYGRGELPEFPSSPDTIVDIVPVDHVVAAIVAVLAHPPEPGDPAYFHVSSGDRNPLTFRVLYDTIRGYFDEHPFAAGDRGAARLPDWRFPGASSVERLLTTSERAHKVADYVVGHAPRGDRTRDLARKLDQQGRRLEFLRRYLDLYREYAQAELRFSDAQTHALYRSLSAEDRASFGFDTAVIDWPHYLGDVHCPAVTAPVRRMDEARRKRRAASDPVLKPVREGSAVAAFFDMDGTLLSSNVIETYLWLRLREQSGTERWGEIGRVAAKVPALVRAERRERSAFLRAVYRQYEGARLADLDAIADEHLTDHVLSRLSPDAVRRIREHRNAGQRTVLITGAIRPLTRPLAPLFDHIEAADLAVDDRGVCTGFLASSPLVGESRAAWMRSYAAAHGIDLAASYGYADSHSDLPLLEAVGRPVVVKPDVSLYRHARRQRWTIVDWASSESNGRSLNPAGGLG